MDTITHGIVGALIGKAFFAGEPSRAPFSWREPPKTAGRVAILACTIGAIFPDIDVLAGQLAHNSLALMTWHRSITHSVVMLPAWALLLAGITWFLARRVRWPAPEFGDLVAIYLVGHRKPHFSGRDHLVRNDGLEPAQLLARLLGPGPYRGPYAHVPGPHAATRRLGLSPAKGSLEARDSSLGHLLGCGLRHRPIGAPAEHSLLDGRVVLRGGRLGLLFSAAAPAQQRFSCRTRQVVPHRSRSDRRPT